jgi:NADPH-dependent 2,4-dienoyl-CoA reductase/sulfur reductase-like enzyme
MRTKPKQRHEVVVIGGGYAGTLAAIRLAGRAGRRAHVTLVNSEGVLVQRLRLHQVAAGQDVRTYPLARLTGPAVDHVHGRATALDLDHGRVRVAAGDGAVSLPYDTLILATGSTIDVASVPGGRAPRAPARRRRHRAAAQRGARRDARGRRGRGRRRRHDRPRGRDRARRGALRPARPPPHDRRARRLAVARRPRVPGRSL